MIWRTARCSREMKLANAAADNSANQTAESSRMRLSVSSDFSRLSDLTTWFFQRNPSLIGKQLTANGGIVCLCLSSYDKLQLVNAPEYLHNELLECIGPMIQSHQVLGLDFEVKLVGHPWTYEEVSL